MGNDGNKDSNPQTFILCQYVVKYIMWDYSELDIQPTHSISNHEACEIIKKRVATATVFGVKHSKVGSSCLTLQIWW